MNLSSFYTIFPLGDSAVTIDLGNRIDEKNNKCALALHDWLQAHRFPGLLDITVAYSSVTVFYDPALVREGKGLGGLNIYSGVEGLLRKGGEEVGEAASLADGAGQDTGGRMSADDGSGTADGHFFRIPVCYEGEYAPDLETLAREKGVEPAQLVEWHHQPVYRVYMIGFLPGFPYMGPIDPRLESPRKKQPVPVASGGVGLAGKQTGIYSLSSPGGWQIIGRTPVGLFQPHADVPIRLQAGDRVKFYPVSAQEFRDWEAKKIGITPFI